ncbi:putative ABC transport system permease protein [Anaerosphaera aminiphila DSM 21120]|uniref:Putative ABC transport system permease protein n=1 Tax=Anaerosphaera aminiphila DSM 21120 TaxID=1120995 RepID=A0A1M5PD72_9FIRM|nr:ABC transporter permease [Anaerosphaera aminiphila]SHG99429.1 putative ABC transport system permease protein [Anaerosphaera aminiphila DSM 21120]
MGAVLMASLEIGLIFSLLAIGVMLTYKILDIADLSVEGTFPLGAFVFSSVVMNGLSPYLGMLLSFCAGLLAGFLTFVLYKKLKIAPILAGILTMTILYSVNLRITGSSNVPLNNYDTIFSKLEFLPKVVILIVIVVLLKIIMDTFFKTEKGYLLIVTGDNESLVKSLGKNPDVYTMVGLMLANGLVSLSGCLMAQYQGFADAQMGATMIVTALASIIIGDTFMKNSRKLKMTTRAIIGAIAYRIIIGIAIDLGLNPNDLKAVTAITVIIFILYNNVSAVGMSKLKNINTRA